MKWNVANFQSCIASHCTALRLAGLCCDCSSFVSRGLLLAVKVLFFVVSLKSAHERNATSALICFVEQAANYCNNSLSWKTQLRKSDDKSNRKQNRKQHTKKPRTNLQGNKIHLFCLRASLCELIVCYWNEARVFLQNSTSTNTQRARDKKEHFADFWLPKSRHEPTESATAVCIEALAASS